MTIDTKFNLGQKVWIIHRDEIRMVSISGFEITISGDSRVNESNTVYHTVETVDRRIPQNKIFLTKSELINSL